VAAAALAGGALVGYATRNLGLGVAVGAVVVAAYALVGLREAPDTAAWRIGADAERATARLLAAVGRSGAIVLHDRAIPHARANIDTIVVAPSGVWTVDTKRWRRDQRVHVHRGVLRCGPTEHTRAVAANRWAAGRVSRELARFTAAPVPVQPVIAVHGAAVPRGLTVDGVDVVAAHHLPRLLHRGRALTPHQVRLLAAAVAAAFPAHG
jgi:hypothetical protein